MLHVEVSRITADPRRLADAVSYLTSEVRPVMERQPGYLGTSLLLAPEAGVKGFESFWASNGALMDSGDVIAAGVRESVRRAGGTVTRERYAVLVFERAAPWRGGRGVRVTVGAASPPDHRAPRRASRSGSRRRYRHRPANPARTRPARSVPGKERSGRMPLPS